MNEEKRIYICPDCGATWLVAESCEALTCDDCGQLLALLAVEYWDCNGEFLYQELVLCLN